MAKKPTIADVALHAGVSKGLVSFVVNGRPGVAEPTRQRVLASAKELGWRPSRSARTLSTRTSYAMGLVLRRDPAIVAGDPFFPGFIAGVETVLSGEGRVLVLSLVPDEAAETQAYRSLVEDSRIDGAFLTDVRTVDHRIGLLQELELPTVMIGRARQSTPWPTIAIDDTAGLRRVVEHLIEGGHRRIAHVAGDVEMVHGQARLEAFASALAEAGLSPHTVITTDFSTQQGADATRQLLAGPDRPTAIVYANDLMAIAGLAVAHELNIDVPSELSITGFDGIELGRHVWPPLTSVVSDAVAWGAAAARALMALINGQTVEDLDLPPAKLIMGGSSGPLQHRSDA